MFLMGEGVQGNEDVPKCSCSNTPQSRFWITCHMHEGICVGADSSFVLCNDTCVGELNEQTTCVGFVAVIHSL